MVLELMEGIPEAETGGGVFRVGATFGEHATSRQRPDKAANRPEKEEFRMKKGGKVQFKEKGKTMQASKYAN